MVQQLNSKAAMVNPITTGIPNVTTEKYPSLCSECESINLVETFKLNSKQLEFPGTAISGARQSVCEACPLCVMIGEILGIKASESSSSQQLPMYFHLRAHDRGKKLQKKGKDSPRKGMALQPKRKDPQYDHRASIVIIVIEGPRETHQS
jgi:hypothetical protein